MSSVPIHQTDVSNLRLTLRCLSSLGRRLKCFGGVYARAAQMNADGSVEVRLVDGLGYEHRVDGSIGGRIICG